MILPHLSSLVAYVNRQFTVAAVGDSEHLSLPIR
jgi:hypothetical protein